MSAVELVKYDFDAHPGYGAPRGDWLEARRAGLGGSDAPAIAGLDPWRSPLTVYYDKIGELEEEPETPAMRWGSRLEQPIADEFEDRNDVVVVKPTALYQSSAWPFMLANPDRLLFLAPELVAAPVPGLEIKTSRLTDDWRDGPPVRVQIQCQHYMAVMGWARMAVAVLLHGREYEQWVLERDDETIELLVGLESEFWQHVQERRPPPTDGHSSTTSTLEALYRVGIPDELELDDVTLEDGTEARALLLELTLARRMKKDAEADVDELTNALKSLLGAHEAGTLDGKVVVTWKAGKAKARRHNCPQCPHEPEGPPSRTFLPREVHQ